MSVWMNYYVDRLSSGDFRGVAAMQSAKDVGAEFKALTASERKVPPFYNPSLALR